MRVHTLMCQIGSTVRCAAAPVLDRYTIMRTDELDFHLPADLIAQEPVASRPASRLLHYVRRDRSISHRQFSDLPSLLRRGDLLVFNNAKVIPARFYLRKPTGGRFEGLFLSQTAKGVWQVLLKNVGAWKTETIYRFESANDVSTNSNSLMEDGKNLPDDENQPRVRILSQGEEGQFTLAVEMDDDPLLFLEKIGRMPLPPYIQRDKYSDHRDTADRTRYQTVYASQSGSVAAPTAGLHFDQGLMKELDDHGIERAEVTLHVGLGTFKPVTAASLEEHSMHVERFELGEGCCEKINRAKRESRRVIAVGTTSARVLESQPGGELSPCRGETGIFIYPPYRWKHVDALLTNFHLPRSTLIALVAAMTGLDEQRRIYTDAIANQYRFFSYGDASFIE